MALLDEIGARGRPDVDVPVGGGAGGRRSWAPAARRLKAALATPMAQALVITLGFAAARVASIPFVGLGIDESYTMAISREWSLSYFDHPPLHQWLIEAFAPLLGEGAALRLPFVALSAATSFVLFLLTRRMFGDKAGVWATLVFNLSGFFTAVSGAWILPDGPLNLCLAAAALLLSAVLFPRPRLSPGAVWSCWLAAGLCLGLAGLSKYQAALFALGLVLFLVTSRAHRKWLVHPAPWAAAALALLIVSPVLIWNAQHHWASFRFQGGRGAPLHAMTPFAPITAMLGQAALLLPWVFAVLAASLWSTARAGPRQARRWFFLMLAAPAILIFAIVPIWGERALPHWAMPGWLMAAPLAGAWLAGRTGRVRWPRRWAVCSALALAVIWPLAAVEASTGALGSIAPGLRSDPTVESVPWRNLRGLVVARLAQSRGCLFVAATSWNDGGKVGQAVGDLVPVRVLSDDPRGFGYLRRPGDLAGCDALIVGRAGKLADRLATVGARFQSVQPYAEDLEGRSRTEIRLQVLTAHRLLHPLPEPYVGAGLASAALTNGSAK